MKKLDQIKTAGFVLRPQSPEIKSLYIKIKAQFEAKGIEVILDSDSAEMVGVTGVRFGLMCQESDFLVSLGGDGTLLSLVRRSYEYNKAVVGINAGNLGFLADITVGDVNNFLDQLLLGECRIDERTMIEGVVRTKEGTSSSFFAFNDIAITRPIISKMSSIKAAIEGEWFNTYKGDGLIISTPTGSTAYNLAAGGPIVYPLTKALIMTPISAHSLGNQKPLVLPADLTIELSSANNSIVAVIDGQDHYQMEEGDVLVISGAKVPARLLHRKESNYFSVLREKLSWGDSH